MQIEFEGDNFADVGDDNRVILLTHTHTDTRVTEKKKTGKRRRAHTHTHKFSHIHMHTGTVKNKQVMRKIQNPHCLRKRWGGGGGMDRRAG